MKLDLLIDMAQLCFDGTEPLGPQRFPVLETLLARGEIFTPAAESMQAALLELFGAALSSPSIAALTLWGEGIDPGDDYWLRVDPVCLQPTRTHLMLTPLPENDLAPEEARILAGTLAPHLASYGYNLTVGHPQRWYVRCPTALDMRTMEPSACAGLLHEDHLPAGRDGASWRRLITEAQMLLHSLPVNEAREAAGKLPANAIWPWGGGRAPAINPSTYACVRSDDPLALGLARGSGALALAAPANANDTLAQWTTQASGKAQASEATLASILIALAAPHGLAATALARLEDDWFGSLATALSAGRLDELRIMLLRPERALGRRVLRTHLRRWWRRSRPFSACA